MEMKLTQEIPESRSWLSKYFMVSEESKKDLRGSEVGWGIENLDGDLDECG
jgi:hypothetical protein